jgi:predicted transcriptional regulator
MIYLEDDQYAKLSRLARHKKRSVAALVRTAVDSLLKRHTEEIDYMSIVGIAKGEPDRVSEEVESYLQKVLRKKRK